MMAGNDLAGVAREVGAIVVFRALPVAGYAVASKAVRPVGKLAVAAAMLAAAAGARSELPIAVIAAGYAYFTLAAASLPRLTRALRAGSVTRGAVFAACALVFYAVPAVAGPALTKAALLVLGWDMTLSAYSYCVEVAKSREEPSQAECLFFLLVNPALVYARRGERRGPPGVDGRGILRALAGVATFVVGLALVSPFEAVLRARAETARGSLFVAAGAVLACGLARFALEYARQSALASLQIGLLRQVGHALPERYARPLLATGPADFWRRWNTYTGQWLMRYVFSPVSLDLGAAVRGRRARAATAGVAILAAFGVCGLMHDVSAYATSFAVETRMIELFLANGALVVASAALRAPKPPGAGADAPRVTSAASIGARATLWTAVAGSFYLWLR